MAAVVVAGREPPIAPEPKRGWAQGAGLQPLLRPNPQAARRCAAKLAIRERQTPADPTNFGERRPTDAEGGLVPNQPSVIVLHETVMSLGDTLRFFRRPIPAMLIRPAITCCWIAAVWPTAWFLMPSGPLVRVECLGDGSIRHRPLSSPLAGGSINNVALHLSLESPADGRGDDDAHSGYSRAQYERLAEHVLIWQLRWGIPMRRITTHAAVDRSHSRRDPRSFRWERFDRAWLQAASSCGISTEGPYGLDAMPQI